MKVFCLNSRGYYMFIPLLILSLVFAHWFLSLLSPLKDKIIVVDAGHGGIDSGANRQGVLEKDINLAVALLTKAKLNDYGAKVILSREGDYDLSKLCDDDKIQSRYKRDLHARLELVSESDADLFISIHANAVANTRRYGAVCFYSGKSESSRSLAESIQNELGKVVKTSLNPVAANFFVLRNNKAPAVLIEVGYITNSDERRLLLTPEHQEKVAEAIAAGIQNYWRKPFSARIF